MVDRLLALFACLIICTPLSTQGAFTWHRSVADAAPDRRTGPADSAPAAQAAPLMFIENVGQFDERARFQVRGSQGLIWLAQDAIWFTLVEPRSTGLEEQNRARTGSLGSWTGDRPLPQRGVHIKLTFVGANHPAQFEPFDRLDTRVSYFLGKDPEGWRTEVPVWRSVRIRDWLPGLDLELSGDDGQMVLSAVARPGADLAAVQMKVEGADGLALEGDRLWLDTAVGEVTIPLLRVDVAPGTRLPRPAIRGNQVAAPFALGTPGAQATSLPLGASATDLFYATFLGGGGRDDGTGIATDESGAAYVTGQTLSADFPASPGSFDGALNSSDAFVAKLNGSGSALIYATFLGGNGNDCFPSACAIAVGPGGDAYVTGSTDSVDFPATPGALDTTCGGCGAPDYYNDAFAVRLNASGSALVYATYLGGSNRESGNDVAVDGTGAAYLTGTTSSTDFDTTPSGFDGTLGGSSDGYVVKLNSAGSALAYATLLGGSSGDGSGSIAVEGSGAAYLTGTTSSSDFPATPGAYDAALSGSGDAFVAKLNATGSALAYATYLGGSGGADEAVSIAVDGNGAAYVAGTTGSADFPTTPGAFDPLFNGGICGPAGLTYPCPDVFVVKMDVSGSSLAYATFIGGSERDRAWEVALDGLGQAYVTGSSSSPGFPITPDAFDPSLGGGTCGSAEDNYPCPDAFVLKVNGLGSGLIGSSFLGGSLYEYGHSLAVDGNGVAYVTGWTSSADFPSTTGALDRTLGGIGDAFAAKLTMSGGIRFAVYLPLNLRNE